MTHGCLEITAFDDRRRVFLHTFHTGMDIPLAVEGAIRVLADYHEWIDRHDCHTRKKLLDFIKCGIIAVDRLCYAPSAAALIIAAIPCFLEPAPGGFRYDGYTENLYKLKISRERWHLRDSERIVVCDFNPVERLCDLHLLRPLLKP